MTAPPIMRMWVGPHNVTSSPKTRCHWSSRGNPVRENVPQTTTKTPLSGSSQSGRTRRAPAGRRLGVAPAGVRRAARAQVTTPLAITPSRPTKIG